MGPIDLLKAFLEQHRISISEAARQLHVTHPALLAWLSGEARPKAHYREAIERWTDGTIPASAWATEEERAALASVEPFKPGSAAA